MEYENTGAIDKNHNQDAACAVCEYEEENSKIYTEWGRYGSCSTEGHVKVYEGLVMANSYSRYKGENVCVDIERGVHAGNHYDQNSNHNGGELYTTEVEQGAANEEWYPNNIELGCTVCATPTDKAVYTRWGSRTCPTGSTRMYEGFMAASHGHQSGGGYNTLCLTENSHAPPGATTNDNNGNRLYGMEYHNTGSVDKSHDVDAACAVCQHDSATYTFTEWGRYVDGLGYLEGCSQGFVKVYTGLVMSNHYGHQKSESVCVDMERGGHAASSSSSQDGGMLYTTEVEQGASHEDWYPNNIEVGCTVCSNGIAPPSKSPTPAPPPTPITWVLAMKLAGGSKRFEYDSHYWSDSTTYRPDSTDMSNGDAKLEAYNTKKFSEVKICVGTTENCYEYDLKKSYNSAAELFNGNFERTTDMDKAKFTNLWLGSSGSDYDYYWSGTGGGRCGMQRPGFNTQCHDHNHARWGYCVNLPGQGCQESDNSDADSAIGIGLNMQNHPGEMNAGFGEYFIHGRSPDKYNNMQVWMFLQ